MNSWIRAGRETPGSGGNCCVQGVHALSEGGNCCSVLAVSGHVIMVVLRWHHLIYQENLKNLDFKVILQL